MIVISIVWGYLVIYIFALSFPAYSEALLFVLRLLFEISRSLLQPIVTSFAAVESSVRRDVMMRH